jgi:hypothetical protein
MVVTINFVAYPLELKMDGCGLLKNYIIREFIFPWVLITNEYKIILHEIKFKHYTKDFFLFFLFKHYKIILHEI